MVSDSRIGMVLGQAVFYWGSEFPKGVGERLKIYLCWKLLQRTNLWQKLRWTKECDVKVSFYWIIVSLGSHLKTAGGLMKHLHGSKNWFIYRFFRLHCSWLWFQSSKCILLLITLVYRLQHSGSNWKKKRKRSSSFLNGYWCNHMGWGFPIMSAAYGSVRSSRPNQPCNWLVISVFIRILWWTCASACSVIFHY